MFLYKLTFSSGKIYIGQTVRTVEARYSHHSTCAAAGSPLAVHAAWRKYGAPAVEVVSHFDNLEDLNAAEINAIASQDCLSPLGYNLASGGKNYRMHEETKAKISAVNSGRVHGADVRAKVGAATRKNWQDEGYREKVLVGVAASFTAHRRAALAATTKAAWEKRKADGWTMPEDARAKLKGRVFSEEAKARMSVAAKARKREPWSDETKAKMAASGKRSWDNPEHALKRSEAISAAKRSPEIRAKQAAIAKATWNDPVVRARRLSAMAESRARKAQGSI